MNNHPKVDFLTSKKTIVVNVLSILTILVTLIYVIMLYPTLPETIPTHYNTAGEADGWGGKSSIFISPFVAIIMFIPLYFVSKVPHVFNIPVTITEENAPRIYTVSQFFMSLFNLETVLLLCYLAFVSSPGGFSLGIYFLPIILMMYAVTFVLFMLKVNRLK